MEHENDRSEDFVSSHQQLFMSENKYITTTNNMKHHHYHEDEFPFDPPQLPPPLSSSEGHLIQEFQNLEEEEEDQFHGQNKSSNQVFGVHTGSNFDSFDAFPYGSSSSNMDCFEYECKPFADINGELNLHNNNTNNNNNYFQRNQHHLYHQGIEMIGSSNNQMLNLQAEIKPMLNFASPNELSSYVNAGGINHNSQGEYYLKSKMSNNTLNLNTHLMNKSSKPSRLSPVGAKKTWKGRKKNNLVKGQWTVDEDRLLVHLVEQYGIRKWSHIAQMLPGRIGKQCRERWHNHLRPDIKKDTWTEEEDKVLIQSHIEIGNKWAEIAKRLPGRTENSIKNHWNATKRRQYSKRKCRSKYPHGSILQDYIKSLNLDNNLPTRRSSSSSVVHAKNNIPNSSTKTSSLLLAGYQEEHKPHHHQQHYDDLDDICENDRLVPSFDYSNEEVPNFGFDDKIFEDGCNIESLLDGLPGCASMVDGKSFDELEVPTEDKQATSIVAPLRDDFEIKKELDLVEMMTVTQKTGF
ncbi:Transcription factor MYB98 [Linum perenne]